MSDVIIHNLHGSVRDGQAARRDSDDASEPLPATSQLQQSAELDAELRRRAHRRARVRAT